MLSAAGRADFAESSFESIPDKDYVPAEFDPSHMYTEEAVEKVSIGLCSV